MVKVVFPITASIRNPNASTSSIAAGQTYFSKSAELQMEKCSEYLKILIKLKLHLGYSFWNISVITAIDKN